MLDASEESSHLRAGHGYIEGGGWRDMASLLISDARVPIEAGETIQSAAVRAGQNPDAFIFVIGGRPVPMDTVPPEDAEVRAVRVASGG